MQAGNRAISWQRPRPNDGGAPLLLVQGMAGHHALWGDSFLDALAADFDVITFDHRGIGDSTDPDGGDFTIAELADDAVAVMDAAGLDVAHVMGISMGGMVAQEIVLNHAHRVRTLTLGCTYCGGPGSSLAAPGPLRMMQAMGAGDLDGAMRVAYEANLGPAFREDESHFAPFTRTSLSVRVPVPVVLRQAKAAFGHDTSARLPQITAPTLVVHGTADEMLEYANGELIASLVPDAELHSLDGVGHLFWWEQPDVTASLLRRHCLR
ncbi:alpha/beta fold hydrolase [Jatrophihabitans fulvus]